MKDSVDSLAEACRKGEDINQAHEKLIDTMNSLNLEKQLDEFDSSNNKYPMYRWIMMYMRQVISLLQFVRGTRQRNWNLHLAALEELCIWFFAYNRLDYAQNVPSHIARMYDLKTTNPQVWNEMEKGGFAIKKNPVSFTAVGVDQAQEHINKIHKGDGGISGITNNTEALLRYCLSTPHLIRLAEQTEKMLGMESKSNIHHHLLTNSTIARQEKYVYQLKMVLKNSNPFSLHKSNDGSESKLYNLMTKEIMPDDVQDSILRTEERGEAAYREFVKERVCGEKNMWDKMTKIKYFGWSAGCKTIKVDVGSKEMTMKTSNSMMARLLVITRSSRAIDLKEVIGKYEFLTTNQKLMSSDGQLRRCSDKALLMHHLENLVENEQCIIQESLDQTCLLFDGMAVVNEQAFYKDSINNCSDLADYFVDAIDKKSHSYAFSYVLFDKYTVKSSMKDDTRQQRTGGKSLYKPAYKVEDSTQIRDLTNFLASKKTKELLTLYLA